MSHRFISIFWLAISTLCAQAQPAYPVISQSEQKARDDDLLPLLESELVFEQKALAKAKLERAYDSETERAANVHRHQENIKALRREMKSIENQNPQDRRAHPVVKAIRAPTRIVESRRTANFWDPYNRAPDYDDFSTNPRKDSHE
jgi:septal ring factor EnvC (AmiA/AmiB activator)